MATRLEIDPSGTTTEWFSRPGGPTRITRTPVRQGATAEPALLGPVGDPCDPAPRVDSLPIASWGSGLTVAATAPGTRYFRLAARDPQRSLGVQRIIVGFVESSAEPTDETEESDSGGEDPDEIEIEPDLFDAGSGDEADGDTVVAAVPKMRHHQVSLAVAAQLRGSQSTVLEAERSRPTIHIVDHHDAGL